MESEQVMGRELRRVPADWEHPKKNGKLTPLFDQTFKEVADEWKRDYALWERGFRIPYGETEPTTLTDDECGYEYWQWAGDPPDSDYYRPDWPEESRTHFQMYETCSEGTPLSPVFDNVEDLARWLADNGASSFGDRTATYEQWLACCKSGWAISAVMEGGKILSGVEHMNPAAPAREKGSER